MSTGPVTTIGPCRCHGTHLREEEHEEGPSDEHVKAKPLRPPANGEAERPQPEQDVAKLEPHVHVPVRR